MRPFVSILKHNNITLSTTRNLCCVYYGIDNQKCDVHTHGHRVLGGYIYPLRNIKKWMNLNMFMLCFVGCFSLLELLQVCLASAT